MPIPIFQATVFVFDLKIANRDLALQKLEDILGIGMFSNEGKGRCRFVCLHTENNYDNTYERMDVPLVDSSIWDPALAGEVVNSLEVSEDGGNWLESLKLSLEVMAEIVSDRYKNFARRHIVFITDLATPLPDGTDTTQLIWELKESFQNNRSYLYILGPDVRIKDTISYPNNNASTSMSISHLDPESTAFANLEIAKQLLEEVPGTISSFETAIDIYFFSKSFYPRQNKNDNLKIGNITIPCVIHTQFIKKGYHVQFKGGRNTRRMEWVHRHNIEEVVDNYNVTQGVMLHGKFIGLTDDIKRSFKVDPGKTFEVLCFVPRSQVKEYLLCKDGTNKITCNPNDSEVFSALLDVLLKEDKVAIAQWNYRNGLEPKCYLLIPDDDRTFSKIRLAFYEDIKKEITEGSVSDIAPDSVKLGEEEKEDIFSFLQQHDVVENEGVLKLDANIRMQPSNIIFYQRMKNKHLGRELGDNVSSAKDLVRVFSVDNTDQLIPPVPNNS